MKPATAKILMFVAAGLMAAGAVCEMLDRQWPLAGLFFAIAVIFVGFAVGPKKA